LIPGTPSCRTREFSSYWTFQPSDKDWQEHLTTLGTALENKSLPFSYELSPSYMSAHVRFSSTGIAQKIVLKPKEETNPPLTILMGILNTPGRAAQNQAKLDKYIRDHYAKVT